MASAPLQALAMALSDFGQDPAIRTLPPWGRAIAGSCGSIAARPCFAGIFPGTSPQDAFATLVYLAVTSVFSPDAVAEVIRNYPGEGNAILSSPYGGPGTRRHREVARSDGRGVLLDTLPSFEL
jgi:hypothetical protein